MKRRRRLRRFVPDEELLRRRAAGVPLRELARDYRVAHTTLGRYFARPEVKKRLREAGRQLRLEQEVRQRAEEQLAAEREQQHGYQAALAEWRSRRSPAGSGRAGRPPRLPLLTRAEMHSTYDKEAEQVVAAGGGTQTLITATDLRTLEHALQHVDPVILSRAFDNDALERAQPQPLTLTHRPRLRRLVPDTQLLRRRAKGEPLRRLAHDYDVAHTTLARFFAHPETKQLLRHTAQQLRAERQARTARRSTQRRLEQTRQ